MMSNTADNNNTTMAKTVLSPSHVLTAEGMTSPASSAPLLADKRSPGNGHNSPARAPSTGKTTPSSTEKKALINGLPSPLNAANGNITNHTGKPYVEGYMKTDDRMRLAKERREERERSLAAREQLMREKDRRARLQYERTVEERWRRLEEQRQKEEQRRTAVEEKRKQQLEEDKERLEALMRRSLERSLQLEQRTRRWIRCPAGGDSENAPPPFSSAASAFPHGIARPLPASSESAPCSPHRSPFRGSLHPADPNRIGLQGGSQSTPNTPKKERLRRERRTASPAFGSPVRRAESPAMGPKHLTSPSTPKLTSKMRSHSPSAVHQQHHLASPVRHHPILPTNDKKTLDDRRADRHGDDSKNGTPVKKKRGVNSPDAAVLQAEKTPDTPKKRLPNKTEGCDQSVTGEPSTQRDFSDQKDLTGEGRDGMTSRTDTPEKKAPKSDENDPDADKRREPLSPAPAGKLAAGTSSAEEASRILAERRRQARVHKEQEEKRRCEEEARGKEEERLRAEQLKKLLAAEQQRKEEQKEARRKEEEARKEQEELSRRKEEEERRDKEAQEKELQTNMDMEKEKAKAQDREIQMLQEEEERQLRKKRIEEIMKRTRKIDSEAKKEEQVEDKPVSPPPGEINVQISGEANEQAIRKVEFQVNGPLAAQDDKREPSATAKRDAIEQAHKQKSVQVQKVIDQPKTAPSKAPDGENEQNGAPVNKNGAAQQGLTRQESQVATQEVNKDSKQADIKVTDPKKTADTKASGVMNIKIHASAEVSKSQSLREEVKVTTSRTEVVVNVTRPVLAPLSIGQPSLPPVIKLEPMDGKDTGSCDEVQSMEVSPELISIPEFSPINEVQNSISNTRALEDLLDLTGSVSCPKGSSESTVVGDCNKNLIGGVCSPMTDSKLIQMPPPPSSNKLSVQ